MDQKTQPHPTAQRYRIGDLIVDAGTRELRHRGRRLKLQRRAFEALLYLIAQRDRVVSKDELWQQVWDSRPVSDSVIPRAISRIRGVLGNDDESWIQTVHGVGYRFVRPVVEERPDEAPAAAPRLRAVPVLALLLLAIAAGAGWWMWRAKDPPRIAILPVEIEGTSELDWVRYGVLPLMEQVLSDDGVPHIPAAAVRATLARHHAVDDRAEQARILRLTHGADQVWLPRLRLAGGQYELTLGAVGGGAAVSVVGPDPVLVAVGASTRMSQAANWRADRNRPYRKVVTDDPFINEAYARGLDARLRSDWQAAEDFFETVLNAAPDLHWAKYQLSLVTRRQGQWERTARLNEELLAAARDTADRELEGSVQSTSGTLAWRTGDLAAAERWYREAERTFEAIGSRHSIASVYGNQAILASVRAEFDRAEDFYARAGERYRELGDGYNESAVLKNWGLMNVDRGRLREAETLIEQSLRIRQRLGLERESALNQNALADIAARMGRWTHAMGMQEKALETVRELGDRIAETDTLADICQIHHHQGRLDEARRVCGESLFVARQIGNPAAEAKALLHLAKLEFDAERWALAHESNDRAQRIYQQLGYADGLASSALLALRLALEQAPDTDLQALSERAGAACEAADNDIHRAQWNALHAQVLGRGGQLDAAQASWREALRLIDGTHDLLARVDLHGAHLEWLIDQSRDAEDGLDRVEAIRASAIETAASQRALARHFARVGMHDQSRRAAERWRRLAGEAWSEHDQRLYRSLTGEPP